MPLNRLFGLCALIVLIGFQTSRADEGMWTFDNFPGDAVKSRYGTAINSEWLDHVRLATVRLPGCTGSFVSSNGLVLTNHHCVASCLDDLSTAQHSLRVNGF